MADSVLTDGDLEATRAQNVVVDAHAQLNKIDAIQRQSPLVETFKEVLERQGGLPPQFGWDDVGISSICNSSTVLTEYLACAVEAVC